MTAKRGQFEFLIGKHAIRIDVPEELVTGDEAMLLARRLHQLAKGIETSVRVRDALADASRAKCGCASCVARRATVN